MQCEPNSLKPASLRKAFDQRLSITEAAKRKKVGRETHQESAAQAVHVAALD